MRTSPTPDTADAPVDPGPSAERSLEALRALLSGHRDDDLASARARLDLIERRLEALAGDVEDAGRLPEVVLRHAGVDTPLQRALAPDVELILHSSIRERPDRMAEALYPVMGPVIRRIVEQLFKSSPVDGAPAGGVEQLFLMHRASGLLIAHVGRGDVVSSDPDMVSGMLSAIRSFVQEAFGANDFDGLHAMQVGDMNLRVAWGPSVVLAAVVRGIEPGALPDAMERTLAELHADHARELAGYAGDDRAFADVPDRLRGLLSARSAAATPPTSRWRGALVPLGLALGALALVLVAGGVHDTRRWERFLERLEAAPGIALVSASRDDGRHVVRVLRDPRAVDPRTLLGPDPGTDPEDVVIVQTPFDGLLDAVPATR